MDDGHKELRIVLRHSCLQLQVVVAYLMLEW